ncbi:HD domain-containing protein [Roseibium sp. Sym1]|uniref:HD domain-containing protein n=1 Tax=Roseibium sp. Sym1 TaxID=3016006 RepID=UPI0022B38CFD|nr:HD domain-containing protein [Roseibium sp. Sym1]
MMTTAQAQNELDRHLAGSRKARHSQIVSHLMKNLAETKRQNAELWEVVGLCHDLDDDVTKSNRQLHGIVTARWLEDRLPEEALEAIKAHDHRTGIQSHTELADALKLADALAIAAEDAGREFIAQIHTDSGWQNLSARLANDRPYLCPIIAELAGRMNLGNSDLVRMFEKAPHL